MSYWSKPLHIFLAISPISGFNLSVEGILSSSIDHTASGVQQTEQNRKQVFETKYIFWDFSSLVF